VCVPLRAHDPINANVTWTGEIGRLVQARCTACHVAGGRGPMSLTSYEEARPWARAIREEVLARRMPKWHAARGYGEFSNDRSLTPFEIALFVAWVDGGARKTLQPQREPSAIASANARARGAGGAPAPKGMRGPASTEKSRQVLTLSCRDQPLPPGRLLAVRPQLDEGGSAGISVLLPDGTVEIVAWVRGFEKKFTETYWLRNPIALPPGSRLRVEAEGRCRIGLTID
jgi:hypothetical protein